MGIGVLGSVGLGFDGERAERIDAALARPARVRLDAAPALHGARARPVEVEAYLLRWLLVDDAGARPVLRFLGDPLWRDHVVTDVEGASLVRACLDRPGSTPAQRLRGLHDGPWTLSGIREELRRTGWQRRQTVDDKRSAVDRSAHVALWDACCC